MKEAAVSGMFWVFIDSFIVRGISFIGTIFLARLLSPGDFGLIAMIAVFVTLGLILVDSGLSSSLIRNLHNEDDDYTSVFFFNLAVSLILYVIFYFLAPLLSRFYEYPILAPIIRIYCIGFIFSGLSSVQSSILIKELKFRRLALLNVPGVIIGNLIGIWMGLKGYGTWSIVGMYLSTQCIQTVALWLGTHWKPKFRLNLSKLKYHYRFGSKLLLSSLINTMFANIYVLLIGKVYPLRTTGYFDRAYTFNQYPLTVLIQIIGKVSFPLLAGIQNETMKVKKVFKTLIGVTFFVAAPAMLLISAIAEPLIVTILGESWKPIAPILTILCCGGVFSTLQSLNVNILKVYGRSDLILRAEAFLKVFLVVSLAGSYFLGFQVLLWSIVLNSVVSLLVHMYFVQKVIDVTVIEQLTLIFPTLLISGLMFLALGFARSIPYLAANEFLQCIYLGVIGIGLYLSASFILRVPPLLYGIDLIKRRFKVN